jgi:hypothetical protein
MPPTAWLSFAFVIIHAALITHPFCERDQPLFTSPLTKRRPASPACTNGSAILLELAQTTKEGSDHDNRVPLTAPWRKREVCGCWENKALYTSPSARFAQPFKTNRVNGSFIATSHLHLRAFPLPFSGTGKRVITVIGAAIRKFLLRV